MPIITIGEIVDLILMTIFVGYIFSDIIPVRRDSYDPLTHYRRGFDFEALKFAILATAPAIIVHEMAHKFMALGFGLSATFFAFYRSSFTLMLGILAVISKLTGFGFVFIVPGFVGISGNGTNLQFALAAFAGPFVNLILWLGSWYLLKNKIYRKKHHLLLALTQRINMFLFIFNMLPIPGFDGYKVFTGLIRTFIG
ncbi:M50 family metallopeptidase [Candidatus Woesearchaeota archaeon]|nr:M50 family metallopeptidase [Candidatus Woesearchaeota archaeon]